MSYAQLCFIKDLLRTENFYWEPVLLTTGLKGFAESAMKASISSTVRGTQVRTSIPSAVTAMFSSIRTCTQQWHFFYKDSGIVIVDSLRHRCRVNLSLSIGLGGATGLCSSEPQWLQRFSCYWNFENFHHQGSDMNFNDFFNNYWKQSINYSFWCSEFNVYPFKPPLRILNCSTKHLPHITYWHIHVLYSN